MTAPRDPLDQLVQAVALEADLVILSGHHTSKAEATRAAIRRAFEVAAANGLIHLVPMEQWPEYVSSAPADDEAERYRQGENFS